MADQLMTLKEVAILLDVPEIEVMKLPARGLKYVETHGRVFFQRSVVDRFRGRTVAAPATKGAPTILSYWMIPRSVRKLVTVQAMVQEDVASGVVGSVWKGNRSKHRERDLNQQVVGLRGKGLHGFLNQNPGGSRTDVALLAALGLYAFDPEGRIELTQQGEALLHTDNPAGVLTEQLFQVRYPSPYSVTSRLDPAIELFPYRFLFQLLLEPALVDNANGEPRLHQKEIAEFVIPVARSMEDLEAVVDRIVQARRAAEELIPSKLFVDIANTFLNNMEITGYLKRAHGGDVWLQNEAAQVAVATRLATPPREIPLKPGEDDYQFQRRLGMAPGKVRLKNRGEQSNRVGAEHTLRLLIEEEFQHNPYRSDQVNRDLIRAFARQAGTSEEKVEAVLQEMATPPEDQFSQAYLELSRGGKATAREFEWTTTKLLAELGFNPEWVGKEGSAPDILFTLAGVRGIVDCKAEAEYTISRDHLLRMTADDGYIRAWEADFFIYIAHGFGSTFRKNLAKVEEKSGKHGAGVTAGAMLELLRLHRVAPVDQEGLRRLLTNGRVVTPADLADLR